MKPHDGESVSVWYNKADMPVYTKLTQNISTEVCIVGGGFGGLLSAYFLALEGKRVSVIESGELAGGQSGRTTAQLSNALDDGFVKLTKYHGEEGLRLALDSHSKAMDLIEKIIIKENIECEFERVSGFLFSNDDTGKELKKEMEAALRGGLKEVELWHSSPLASFNNGPCLHFPNQVQIHPLKFLKSLAETLFKMGVKIYTNTHVKSIKGGKNSVVITRDDNTIECKNIIVATNTPINDLFAIHTKQAAYRTYVLAFEIQKNSIPKAFYWDTMEPYHYIRLESGSLTDTLIIGGEDHKTGQNENPENCYEKLELWSRTKFPHAGDIISRWSGQVMEPVDGLAYLGRNPMDEDNVYIITGDSGHGVTHCTIGGKIITDLIMGRKNPWENLYNPSRITFRSAGNYIQENANVAVQYTEWFETKAKPELRDLPKNEGVVFRDGTSMVAAFKNTEGNLEYMSAVCPHLAGIVNWNTSEKSWDCPCHGSRFDCHGKVIEGPAFEDLGKVDFAEDEDRENNEYLQTKEKNDDFFDKNVY